MVRMKLESPNIERAVTSINGAMHWHWVLEEAAKDFLVDERRSTQGLRAK